MSARDNQRLETEGPRDWSRGRPPIRLAQGRMGALLAAVAGLIVLVFSISQQRSIIELCRSLVSSILIFWLLGWCCAFAMNWHFRSAYRRLAAIERKEVAKVENAKANHARSEDNVVDESQTSPASVLPKSTQRRDI